MGGREGVLVTGAGKGIGEACVGRLVGVGWRVYAGVRAVGDGEALTGRFGEGVVPVRLDVTRDDDVGEAAAAIGADLGEGGRLVGIVNNAGIATGGPLEFLPLDRLRHQLEVNVIGQVRVTQAMLPLLRRSRGRIVFIGSISGLSALPFTGAYAASKHALEAIADSWRVELRPWGIEVVLIEPGTIATPIWRTSLEAADRMAADLPPESESYYGRLTRGIRKRAEDSVKGLHGQPADSVARVVARALAAGRVRPRYVVGTDARVRRLLKRWLPDRVHDSVIARGLERLAARAD